jgi:hypothetical protein
LLQLIVASERTTKKTAVPSIFECESVATQRPSSVDFVGPQRARHNILIKVITREDGKNKVKIKQIKRRRKEERNIGSYIILDGGREVEL